MTESRRTPDAGEELHGTGELFTGECERQLIADVFDSEIGVINARRKAQGLNPVGVQPGANGKSIGPSVDFGLVGLALSGGGVRSATFNLGVLQGLYKNRVFEHIDYLSTVSGGGYIGSCLTAAMSAKSKKRANGQEAGHDGVDFPFSFEIGGKENAAFRHLRNYSNYLAPRGLLDMIQAPVLMARGILTNLVVLLPYILLAAIVTIGFNRSIEHLGVYNLFEQSKFLNDILPLFHPPFFVTKWLSLILIIFVVSSQFVGTNPEQRLKGSGWRRRERFARTIGYYILILIAVAFIELQPFAILALHNVFPQDADVFVLLVIVGIALIGLVLPVLARNASTIRGKATLYLAGLLGPLVVWLLYLVLSRWGIRWTQFRPYQEGPYELTAAPDWVRFFPKLIYEDLLKGWGYTDCFFCDGPVLMMTLYFIVILIVVALTFFFVDANRTSLHSYYRDRLSKAYLFEPLDKPDTAGESVTHLDTQRLWDLRLTHTPYLIINAALNLQSSSDPKLGRRKADSFIFSQQWTGSVATRYCHTKTLEEDVDQNMNLGTAMAISGAAIAPNRGEKTVRPLLFIMSMLNIRLGYWLRNPKYIERGVDALPEPKTVWQALNRLRFRMITAADNLREHTLVSVGPGHFIFEMFGLLNEESRNVNVSDGGHFDNLGIYELLRRKCKFIIACDAEADPDYQFGGLANALRLARIDMGIVIKIDLVGIGRDGMRHCAHGTIDYGNGDIGSLLYIKASTTGDEVEYVREYQARNERFPHESTGDQFFTEDQFEAYRALGFHIVEDLFTGTGSFAPVEGEEQHDTYKSVDEWYAALTQ